MISSRDKDSVPQGRRHLEKEGLFYYSATALSVAVPIIALIIWLGLNSDNWNTQGWSAIHSAAIGGRLSQPQAKAVDLLSSAFIAPLILGCFNYVWFACARVAVVNEYRPKQEGVPFYSLVEVSSTTGGSYDILKLKALLVPRTKRLMFLGLLVLFSAIAKSALGNVIAYEAFTENASGQSPQLRLLSDDAVAVPNTFVSSTFAGTYDYNLQQRASFANEFTGMMTGISLESARSKLNGTTYTIVNATTASLDSLPVSIVELHAVPGRRWSVNCSTWAPETLSILQMGVRTVQYTMTGGQGDLLTGMYPGDIGTLQDAYNNVYPLMAFNLAGSDAWLGFLTSFNLSDDRYQSPYGTLKPVALNMTSSGFTGTKQIMSVWGIYCSIFQEKGSLNMQRSQNGSWTIQSSNWTGEKSQVQPLRLQQLQTNLNYNAPDVTIPGLAPALAGSADPSGVSNLDTLALNFLYASGEAERIAYEVAATNSSRGQPDFFYDVTTLEQVLHYRITYVPLILLVGLAFLLGAALVTTGLLLYTWKSFSGRTFRQVDVLRLLVDSMAGLSGREVHDIPKAGSNGELEDWAKGYRVRYEEDLDDADSKVSLQHVSLS